MAADRRTAAVDVARALLAMGHQPEPHGEEFRARCPMANHRDANPSFTFSDSPDGKLLLNCWSCPATFAELLDALGLRTPTRGPGREDNDRFLDAQYFAADGRMVSEYRQDWPGDWHGLPCDYLERGVVCGRNKPHKHCWSSRGNRKGLLVKLWWPQGADDDLSPAVLCEGPKAARAIQEAGMLGVSYCGGSNGAKSADYTPLKGLEVVIWPDDDRPGRTAAENSARALVDIAASIRMVAIPGNYDGDDAADLDGDERRSRVEAATPWGGDAEDSPPAANPATPRAPDERHDWYLFAQAIADRHLGGRFRYDADGSGWWFWSDGNCWRQLRSGDNRLLDLVVCNRLALSAEIASQLGSQYLQDALEDQRQREVRKQHSPLSDLQAAFRDVLKGSEPRPAPHVLAVRNGVIDLRADHLEVRPHDPSWLTRGVAAGGYFPEHAAEYRRLLAERLNKVLRPESLQEFIKLVGLALSGKAQSHRSLVAVLGPSGSGKGGLLNLLGEGLGDLESPVSRSWLNRREGELDSVGARLAERAVLCVTYNELGAGKVDLDKLLNITGDGSGLVRAPHRPLLETHFRFQLWFTAVSAPRLPTDSGLRRRIGILRTLGAMQEADRVADWQREPGLADALITLGAAEAALVYRPGYVASLGDQAERAQVLQEMDPLAAWLEGLPAECVGMSREGLLERAQTELDYERLTVKGLVGKVNKSDKWRISRGSQGRDKHLELRQPPERDPDLCPGCEGPAVDMQEGLCVNCVTQGRMFPVETSR